MAAAPTIGIGSIKDYHPEDELFSSYMEWVELFFTANSVAEAKKVAALLSVIGSKSYSLVRSLVAPSLPQDKEYKDLVAALKSHYEPKPLVHDSRKVPFPPPRTSHGRIDLRVHGRTSTSDDALRIWSLPRGGIEGSPGMWPTERTHPKEATHGS